MNEFRKSIPTLELLQESPIASLLGAHQSSIRQAQLQTNKAEI